MRRTMPWLVAGLTVLALGCQKNRQPESPMDERGEEQGEMPSAPEEEPFGATETEEMAFIPVEGILTTPMAFSGEQVEGTARVAQVSTDRAFWIEEAGNTLLAILLEQRGEDDVDLQEGQVIRIDSATVRTPSDLSQIEGDPLDAESAQLAFGQPVFLVLDAGDISILSGPGS